MIRPTRFSGPGQWLDPKSGVPHTVACPYAAPVGYDFGKLPPQRRKRPGQSPPVVSWAGQEPVAVVHDQQATGFEEIDGRDSACVSDFGYSIDEAEVKAFASNAGQRRDVDVALVLLEQSIIHSCRQLLALERLLNLAVPERVMLDAD